MSKKISNFMFWFFVSLLSLVLVFNLIGFSSHSTTGQDMEKIFRNKDIKNGT